jgi:hypothetical protein
MAVFSKSGITSGATIQPGHVTQSVDAFTGLVAYDITLSGSLKVTGSLSVSGSITGSITGNLSGNATTSTYVVSNNQNYSLNGADWTGPGNLGILAGSTILGNGVSPTITPPALAGKQLNTGYWVTATKASGSTSTTIQSSNLFIEESTTLPGGGSFTIKENGASSNNHVNFIIVYLQ